jgi:hypothetical protein
MADATAAINFWDGPYWLQTIVQCLKEFLGVFMFLVAYSRLELFDTFTGPLVLYMVLVVLAFPFVNSYLFLLMRWGPWYDTKQQWFSTWWFRTMAQFGLVIGFHIGGACAAWGAVKRYRGEHRWENASLVQTVYTGNTKWIDGAAHPADTKSTVVAPELSYRAVQYSSSDGAVNFMLFLEEFVAVFILLVGILHLVEGVTPGLLQNAFWNQKGNGKADEYVLTSGAAFSSRHREMSIMMQRMMFDMKALKQDVHAIAIGQSLSKGSAAGAADSHELDAQPRSTDIKAYIPVPFMLVFQICILLAAVCRAFPSAHLSMHVSIFNWGMGIDDEGTAWMRIIGGSLAGCAAMCYYFLWYVWAGIPGGGDEKTLGMIGGPLYRNLLLKNNALLSSEMLRIPSLMAVEVDKQAL